MKEEVVVIQLQLFELFDGPHRVPRQHFEVHVEAQNLWQKLVWQDGYEQLRNSSFPDMYLIESVPWVDEVFGIGRGQIRTDLWMRTAVPGVLAAGDVRGDSARQLISAAGDGATAALAAIRYLRTGQWGDSDAEAR